MTQNTTSAVMAQRREPHDSLDDFPTPPWGTRALLMMLENRGVGGLCGLCLEPAANRGFMVRPLKEHFDRVLASDVHDYGCGFLIEDFLWPRPATYCDWIITNPPFRLAKEFTLTALSRARTGVAMLVRTGFAEGIDRYNSLFLPRKPVFAFQFVERLPMVKGRVDRRARSATSYMWLVWLSREWPNDTIFDWIPPSRAKLERPGDYD